MERKKNNKIKAVLTSGLYSLIGVLIITIVLLSVAPSFMLNTFGFRAYIAHYDTMEPTIKENSLVFINRVDSANLDAEELVTFITSDDLNDDGNDDYVTFYFDRTEENGTDTYFYFHVEDSTTDAATMLEHSIVGGYSFSIPVLGLIVDFFASPFGIAVVFVNIGIIGGIVYILKHGNKKETKEESENKA
eukprot:Anaeramoba_ignava/c8415_g1_i1.p4 GENE.c8415_g1_i1~~c8415_g1_i1.p4  ORF type:complete len:190 (-),score=18.66 c8415_g1_i1:59-628(-)